MLNERSLLSQFLHFVAATVASLMVFSLYSIVDGLMVAKGVGEYAMAAVNLAVPFTNVLFSIGVIFAVGTSTIIAIYLGQNQGERANSLFSQNIVLLTCIGLTITVLVFVFLEPFAVLLGAKGVTYQYTIDYLRGLAPFALCFIVSYNMEVLIKTDGYPRLAILTVITGCLANCVLDYIAIFVLNLGVWGAAFATGLSQLLTCVIYLRHFLGGHNTFHVVKFKMDWSIYKRLIPLGFADGVTELCNGVMIFLFNRVILRCLGDDGLVCYTIIAYVNTLIINTMLGISQGSQPLVSYPVLRQGGRGGVQEAAAVRLYGGGHHDGGDLRRCDDLRPPDRRDLPRRGKAGAAGQRGRRAAAVRPVLHTVGKQHPHGRLPDGGGAAKGGYLHLRGPGTCVPGHGAVAAGSCRGRYGHLVCTGDLRGAVCGDGRVVPPAFPEKNSGMIRKASRPEKASCLGVSS